MAQAGFLFETERLGLRPCNPALEEDIKATQDLFQSKAAQEAFGDSVLSMTYDQCKAFVQMRWDSMWVPYGKGSFLIFRKPVIPSPEQQSKLVGKCSMVQEANAEFPDIGYGLFDEEIGKGYATEAAKGLIQYCREHSGVTDVVGFTETTNAASRKVLERLGMTLVATVTTPFQGEQQDSAVYALGEDAQGRDQEFYQSVVAERLRRLERRALEKGRNDVEPEPVGALPTVDTASS